MNPIIITILVTTYCLIVIILALTVGIDKTFKNGK